MTVQSHHYQHKHPSAVAQLYRSITRGPMTQAWTIGGLPLDIQSTSNTKEKLPTVNIYWTKNERGLLQHRILQYFKYIFGINFESFSEKRFMGIPKINSTSMAMPPTVYLWPCNYRWTLVPQICVVSNPKVHSTAWACIWSNKSSVDENLSSQNAQGHKHCSLWVSRCLFNRQLSLNCTVHGLHGNGHCPVWIRMCALSLHDVTKFLVHKVQLYGRLPVCLRTCLFKSLDFTNCLLHT